MNVTSSSSAQSPLDSGNAKRPDGRDATLARRVDAGQDVHHLLTDIQDLLGQLAHVADPDIARLRARLAETLTAAKRAVTDRSVQVRRQVRAGAKAGDAYVRDQPWQAVGIAAAVGLIVGFLVAKR